MPDGMMLIVFMAALFILTFVIIKFGFSMMALKMELLMTFETTLNPAYRSDLKRYGRGSRRQERTSPSGTVVFIIKSIICP
ncbi:hypothetical protein PN36_24050 [Candidatus Thiomargarita nelsonii]|uniref:Uncharacterized protein n=1 Tax=Candidatus Thiomargarita nelsonii TaxID=1003181 RepID=A0A0A6P610_9GAMM|nr:hypothetical protein PN36_24050 [Candidatus Thiomargarita nelsonii]